MLRKIQYWARFLPFMILDKCIYEPEFIVIGRILN